MPITPLHFGILAPINHWLPNRVNNLAFILVNLSLDAIAIQYWAFGLTLPEHTPGTHSFLGAWGNALILCILGIRLQKAFWPTYQWILGCFLGATSHVLLDMLVHSEMLPFYPIEGNLFYMGWMEPLSMTLLPLTIWLIVQYVSGSLGWVRAKLAGKQAQTAEPSA